MRQNPLRILSDHKEELALALTALGVAVITKTFFFERAGEYWKGVITNIGGAVWDVILVVVLFRIYEMTRQRNNKIVELKRRINELKRLNDDYSHAIIGAALRELAELHISDVDFRGIRLTNFSFYRQHGVKKISGSVFSTGLIAQEPTKNFTELDHVDFSEVDCENVTFGKSAYAMVTYKNCYFGRAKLKGASFEGATLEWDGDHPGMKARNAYDSAGVHDPAYVSPFDGADMQDTVFDNAKLRFADFRGTKNLHTASFKNVTGIETCVFDQGVLEQLLTEKRVTEAA